MRWDGTGLPYIEPGDDFNECAMALATSYNDEFSLFGAIDPDSIEAAAMARFMPMAMTLSTPFGLHSFLLPKLHLERCLLDPVSMHVTRTTSRESSRYSFSLNREFRAVTAACVEKHGDGWLVQDLVDSFIQLHDERTSRRIALLSIELWNNRGKGQELIAGEIGYLIGSAYASLSGFSRVSGAGSVQLAVLGSMLAVAGVRVWDLGMPIDYKLGLGGRVMSREQYFPILGRAYRASDTSIVGALLGTSALHSALEVIASRRSIARCTLA